MPGLARSTRPCIFGVFEEISIQRVDPAPDQSPATFWTIEPDRVCLRGLEAIDVIVQTYITLPAETGLVV